MTQSKIVDGALIDTAVEQIRPLDLDSDEVRAEEERANKDGFKAEIEGW